MGVTGWIWFWVFWILGVAVQSKACASIHKSRDYWSFVAIGLFALAAIPLVWR